MRYEGRIYRPPSEASSFILQASIGCSWNNVSTATIHFPQPRRRSYFERLTWGGSLLLDRVGSFYVVETTYGLTVGWVNVKA